MLPFLALFAITLFALSLTSPSQAASKNGPKIIRPYEGETTYGVIVDCGSSGTRVHIYEWDTSLEFPDLLNKIEPMRVKDGPKSDASKAVSMKIQPGLSSLKDNPSRASDYMKPIIDFIYEKIPKKSYKSTSIYMMATAGMRLLDKSTQEKILEDIAKDLRYRHEFAKVRISVISGATEGLYQWITVNSKLQRFAPQDMSTLGIIEMGGSSIQVAYQLKLKTWRVVMETLEKKDTRELKQIFLDNVVQPELSREIPGYEFKKVFSATFLGLGSNSAREAFIDLLIHHKLDRHKWANIFFHNGLFGSKRQPFLDSNNQVQVEDPCLPIGATEIIDRPKKMLDPAYNSHQSVGFNVEAGDETFKVKIVGGSNYLMCRLQLADLLTRAKREKLNCKEGESCSMSLLQNKFIPYEHVDFVGLGELYHTTNLMLDVAGRYDRLKMIRKSIDICSKKYDTLKLKFHELHEKDPARVRQECFKAVWIETFLSDGLKMPYNYHKTITVGKIHGDEIDWTLGAVLDKSLAIERAAEAN